MRDTGSGGLAVAHGAHTDGMENRSETIAVTAAQARDWVTTSRVRVFGTGAATALVLMLICLLVPSPVAQVLLAGVFAVLAIVFGLLASATWFAERSGTTDSTDLWDTAPDDTAGVTDLFSGFSGFTEDGAPGESPTDDRPDRPGGRPAQ